jgi:hypothetical protein
MLFLLDQYRIFLQFKDAVYITSLPLLTVSLLSLHSGISGPRIGLPGPASEGARGCEGEERDAVRGTKTGAVTALRCCSALTVNTVRAHSAQCILYC